jgi:hypothetical protein
VKKFAAFVFALAATGAIAQTADRSEAQNGDFGAKLLVTPDPDEFWREWEKPDTPHVTTTSRISRAQPVTAMIIFHDCRPGTDGHCNLTVRFEMAGPDGHPYDTAHDAIAWHGPPPPNHNLQASAASMGFRLEPTDRLGRYAIFATLTDTVAGKSVRLVEFVTAVDDLPPPIPST